MRILVGLTALVPGAAMAHPGHLAEAAGHSHWIALGAIALAGGIALWAGLKGRGKEAEAEEEAEDTPEEARA
ncbi:DUF6732 family protein [Algicella marina]|uniref:Uncharacterized protein n=1 Tax=Algicella marina TaxID=2683284 RepID=A0A6P1T170_9RHOB|nr:DUF6732 family protein [Algicella marina]QHQ35737.1 hypothetical protein GO499_11395 [Algicella marina]